MGGNRYPWAPRYSANNSRNTSGRRFAIVSRERAAPEGLRRPCSHPCSVRVETPSTSANFCCDSPVRIRASRISGTLMWCTRAALPAFISRAAANNSSPRFRLASYFASAFALSFAIERLPNLDQSLYVNVLANILRVQRHQPHCPVCKTVEMDDAHTTTLAATLDYPADLTTAAGTGNHIARFGIECKPSAKIT